MGVVCSSWRKLIDETSVKYHLIYNFYANTFDIQGYYFYLRSQNNKVDTESIIELINNNKNYLDINNNPKKWIISFIDKNIDYKNRKLSWEKKIQSLSNYGRFKLKKILIVRLFSDNEVEMEKEFHKRERELDSIKVNNYFNYIVEDSNIRNYLNYENINPLKPKQKILQIYELEIETIDPLILDKNDVLKILNLDINTGLTTSDFLDKIFNI